MTAWKRATLVGVVWAGLAAEALAYDWTFCLRTQVSTTDSGIGEDYYTAAGSTLYVARYAQVRVTRGDDTVVPTTYANGAGCISFESPYNTGFHVEMWSRARIPRTDDTDYHNTLEVQHSNGDPAYWHWYTSPGGNGGAYYFETNQTRRSTLLGLASYALYRFSDGLVNKTFVVRDAACPQIPNNSCNSADGSVVYIHPDHNDNKFAVAHEMGHAVVHRWINYHPSASYSVNAGGAECTTPDDMSHALHSKEYQSGALTEGFAQFYAASVWNDQGQTGAWFHYYKDEYKGGSVQEVDVENGPTGGVTSYLENECSGSPDGRGVELDWMRALWDYRTNAGTQPTRYQILRQLKNAVISGMWSHTDAFYAFSAAVADYDQQYGTSFSPRWTELAAYNGVDH